MKRVVLRALPVVVGIVAVTSSVANGQVPPSCKFVAFAPQSDNGAFDIVARRTTCGTAREVASASKPTRFRYGTPRYSALGFRCSGRDERLGGNGKNVVSFRCVHGRSSVSFLRG